MTFNRDNPICKGCLYCAYDENRCRKDAWGYCHLAAYEIDRRERRNDEG